MHPTSRMVEAGEIVWLLFVRTMCGHNTLCRHSGGGGGHGGGGGGGHGGRGGGHGGAGGHGHSGRRMLQRSAHGWVPELVACHPPVMQLHLLRIAKTFLAFTVH